MGPFRSTEPTGSCLVRISLKKLTTMSIHKSLKAGDALSRSRNVLTRYERILQMERQGDFSTSEESPYGLRKTRIMKVKKRGKTKKKKEEG